MVTASRLESVCSVIRWKHFHEDYLHCNNFVITWQLFYFSLSLCKLKSQIQMNNSSCTQNSFADTLEGDQSVRFSQIHSFVLYKYDGCTWIVELIFNNKYSCYNDLFYSWFSTELTNWSLTLNGLPPFWSFRHNSVTQSNSNVWNFLVGRVVWPNHARCQKRL